MRVGNHFKQQYIAKKVDFSQYECVKVEAVDFSYLQDKTIASKEALADLDKSFREDVEEELAKNGLKKSGCPKDKTLVIHLAVTNVKQPNVPVNVGWKVGTGIIAPVPVPNPMDTKGTTAFEAKITQEGETKPLITVSEERGGRGGHLDLPAILVGKYIYFVNTKVVFHGWAEHLGKMLGELKQQKKS